MRILTVNLSIDTQAGGGTAERTYQLSRWLAKENCECTVLTLDDEFSLDRVGKLAGASLIVLPCLWRRFHLPYGGFDLVGKLVRKSDVIHLMGHWSVLNALVCFYAVMYKKPYVVCPAGALPIFGRSKLLKKFYNFLCGKAIIQRASGWIAITKLECDHFESYGINREKIIIIPNCINEEDFALPENFSGEVEKGSAPFTPYILFMGRLNLIKGPDLLLDAFIKVCELYPHFNLVFAGPDNGMQTFLCGKVAKHKLQGRVHFIGNVDGIVKVLAYRNASLLVVPSRQEAMSIVAVEAGICGTPVLLTDQCGLQEIREISEVLEIPATSNAIAESLKVLLADEVSLRSIGLSWKDFVQKKYRWGKIIHMYLECFKKVALNKHISKDVYL